MNIDWPVEKIRKWIGEGKTQSWIGKKLHHLCPNTKHPEKLIYKVCKKHNIQCQRSGPRSGKEHPEWKGGRLVDKDGYILLYVEGHPYARKPRMKYIPEHRLVMEKYLGRYLTPGEVVHHKNRKKDDNRLENLELFSTNADHLRHELKGKVPQWSDEGIIKIARACMRGLPMCNPYLKELDEKELIQKIRRSIE